MNLLTTGGPEAEPGKVAHRLSNKTVLVQVCDKHDVFYQILKYQKALNAGHLSTLVLDGL